MKILEVHCTECHKPLTLTADQFKEFVRINAGFCEDCQKALVQSHNEKKEQDKKGKLTMAFLNAMRGQKSCMERRKPFYLFNCDELSYCEIQEIAASNGFKVKDTVDPQTGRSYYQYNGNA